MPIWEAVVLGIIQGLTEFLPISSTAHLLVARGLIEGKSPEDGFTTIIQLGTLVAVIGYFRKDIVLLLRAVWVDLLKLRFGTTPELLSLRWLSIEEASSGPSQSWRDPRVRMCEVAYESGFQSLTAFHRAFQRILGESPTKYRSELAASGRR